ncbi:MAG: tyrosine--tRNA ligase, partial [Geminicoccaceae bacterium]
MSSHRSDFIRAIVERGFLHQATDLDALDKLCAAERLTAYIGFDATADSLHVGNLVGIMMLRLFQRTGHRPIALVGGGTSKVGDPSFREEGRPFLDDTTLATNLAGIKRSLDGFLEVDGAGRAGLMVNNADWLDHLNYVQLLRDYGQHFTINRMLTFDSVRLRLEREQPLTFLEFNYMIMQAYDFVELARRYDCRLQMGGSDQWGNIVNGVELGRRVDGRTLFGLTTPLITTASGAKMGKTAEGAVWLNRDRLSDFE